MNLEICKKNISGLKLTIIGLRKSGYAAAVLGHELGASIFVSELNSDPEIISNKNKLIKKNIVVEIGEHSDLVYEADFWVISPGVPNDIDIINKATRLKIPIIGEIEFASRFTQYPIIAVTGSNGKTTTVSILHSMLKNGGFNPILAGNIGTPFSEKVKEEIKNPKLGDVYILEISSFQLEFIDQFRPMISLYLNISPDHLDRHKSMKRYIKMKLKMIENHGKNDTVIYNIDDPVLKKSFNNYKMKKVPFSILEKTPYFRVNEKNIYDNNENSFVFIGDIILKGKHNLSNMVASATVAKIMNVDDVIIKNTMENFKGIVHRLQIIDKINQVTYINDSKATNINSVIVAINSFNSPIILLLGGKNKNSDFRLLLPHTKRHVKHIVSYGEAGGEIAAAIGDAVRLNCVSSLNQAVASARNLANPGDIVLMSPGCASFDQFNNFEERGEKFIELVNDMKVKVCD